ncbi:MAG: adenylate/guanylate cyclase domain-containing protein [Pseudomonadota bacterium]|nr:adenylate/guanylate cyclase domain-containing protein [Pseudomonadota bacterium]
MPIIKDNKNLFTLEKNSSGAQRKMAAIFAADVVGYSKLMAQNEKLTLFRLKETRKTTDEIINNLNGRIFSTAGDSIMAEFASPVDAVEAAIEIQNRLKKNISDTSDNIIIEFRMGVNLGDIMVQDNNLYGDNVNIAARLEAVSKPGEICISEKVFQEIKNKVDVKFKFFGNKKLKNISEKINIYISNLNETEENGKSKKFNFKTIGLSALALLSLIILSFTLYNFYFSEKIDYNQNAKNVIDSINSTEDLQSSTSEVDDKTLKISLMEFQIQSENFNEESLNILMSEISKVLTEKDSISTIRSPAGSENLNPPEVMLIATEANSSFVVNGMVFSENNKDYINIKIYEAKRGSLIISKKIILGEDENYDEMVKFLSMFKKDITK